MTTQAMHVDGDRLTEWQSVGVAEGLDTDQEIADFLIHFYILNREEGSSPFLCRRCHVPLSSLCESCQSGHQSAPPPHAKPPSKSSVLHSGKNPSLNNQPSGAGQSQTGTSLSPPESSPSQTGNDLPCIENNHSQTGTSLSPPESSQSQTRNDLPCVENNQSQTSKAPSLSPNKKPDTSHPRRGGSRSEQDPVGKSVEFEGPAIFSQHPKLENPSRQSDPSVRSVLVKEEDVGDDGDDMDSTSCMELISSDQAESSVLKQEDATVTVQDVSVGDEEMAQRDGDPLSEAGGRKRWGHMETKALTWLLGRYDLHAPSTWNDCALLLNAALHTSATGEEWCKLAIRRKLLSPKTAANTGSGNTSSADPQPTNVGYGNTRSADPQCKNTTSDDLQPINTACADTTSVDSRPANTVSGDPQSTKTRSEDTTSVDLEPAAPRIRGQHSMTAAPCNREPDAPRRTRSCRKSNRTSGKRSRGAFSRKEPQDPSRLRSDGRKAARLTVVRQSQRPGLRSSVAVALQLAPDPQNDNRDDKSFSSKGEQRQEDIEDEGACEARQVAKDEVEDSACPEDVDTEDTKEEVTASGVANGEGLRSSLEDGEMSCSVDAPELSTCNRLSWHYLGVADVDLPDLTQKRKSFRRSPNDRYQCKECSSSFTHRGILVKHIRLAHLKWRPYHCHVCSAAYATKTKLQRHINVAHTKIRPFCCEICGASFVDHYTLLGHRETHDEDRQYRFFCELCGKGYYGMRELKRHMETHSTRPTKSLLCWVCGKAVRTTQYLRIHMRTHSPEKAFTCGACHHVFTSKCALQKHHSSRACGKRLDKNKAQLDGRDEETRKKQVVSLMRQRRERKPGSFQCDICHKHFSAKKNIYKHKRSVHGVEAKREIDDRIIVTDPEQIARYLTPKNRDTASLKFSCDICSKRYSSQESMRKHKNIVHFGRRDHKCDVCHKTFTRHTSLIEHRHNVHNPGGKSARPTSQCDICQKTFAAKNSLRKHLKTVHFGLLPHSCVVCGKKFASRYHLREHAKTSGHSLAPQDEGKVGKPSSTDSFHHVPSPHSPLPDTSSTCSKASRISPPSPSCASPTLGPLSPWTPVHPASDGLTHLQHMSVEAIQQRELPTSASTVTASLQPVRLWNMS